MVEGMPRDAACGVARRPLTARKWSAIGRLAQHIQHRGTHQLDGGRIHRVRSPLQCDAHLAGIGSLGLDHVGDHLVAVSATAPWSLAELGGCRGADVVERRPGGIDQADETVRVCPVGRTPVEVRHDGRDAEVGAATARYLVHDLIALWVERLAGVIGDDGVARGRGLECLKSEVGSLRGACPARPVDRSRERLLGARLDDDRDLHPLAAPVPPRRSLTSVESRATSRPSGPSASTSADATTTPSAPAFTIDRTWAAVLTPNPTATGMGETALTSRTSFPTEAGSEVRAPVTPTSDTQYRKPPDRAAIAARRAGEVVGATR